MTLQGGILADSEIHAAIACGDIEIDPYEPAHVNPVSIDLTLGDLVRVYSVAGPDDLPGLSLARHLDARANNGTLEFEISDDGLILSPGVGYLMHTRETIHTKKYVPIIDGKSSLGRLFMSIHETAGFGDPGYRGQYTLEVSVVHPLRVYAGMRIAQMRFHTICGQVEKSYAGNYTGDDARGPVASKAYKQFKGAR